jgi:sugar phosphate permease
VSEDQVGAASGISNMARYIGSSVAVAAAGLVYTTVTQNHLDDGATQSDALASGLAAACVMMAIWAALGVVLIRLMKRVVPRSRAIDRAAAAAATTHTIPTDPVSAA